MAEEQPRIAVISTVGCKYCKVTKARLKEAGVAYEDVELSRQPEILAEVKRTSGRNTVPQVFVDGVLLGGSEDTLKMLEDGSLQKKLSTSGDPLPQTLRNVVEKANLDFQAGQDMVGVPAGMTLEQYRALEKIANRLQSASPKLFTSSVLGKQKYTASQESVEACLRTFPADAAIAAKPQQVLAELQRAQLIHIVVGPEGHPADIGEVHGTEKKQTMLRLNSLAPNSKLGQPLNAAFPWFGPARPANKIAETLRQAILGLYDKHLAPDGKSVNYKALGADPAFKAFAAATAELQAAELTGLSREERMALFINLYNAVIVHALVVFGPAGTLPGAKLYWFAKVKYTIGGIDFSTLDMEHGVLRGNSPSPVAIPALLGLRIFSKPYFAPGHPCHSLVCDPLDPRIHMALVCGAKSCPPIKLYSPDNLDEGLSSAATAFCEGEAIVDVPLGTIRLSSIFKWYKADFGGKLGLLDFLQKYLPPRSAADLTRLLQTTRKENIKLEYQPYDWSTNSA